MQTIPPLKKPDGSKAVTPKHKAETLNDFFPSVFTNEDCQNIPPSPSCHVNEVLSSIEITPETVLAKLNNLNPNKSPGHDKWHPHFLRELADLICVPIAILFNKSLREGAHKSWLKATITAIYKKGVRSEAGNYRPISITSVISKIMESIVRDAIVAHMVKNDLLTDEQHGFVPGRDCITQLLLCLEDWTSMTESGEAFDVIYTDFAKAFDSVARERLLRKLDNIGIKGDLLNWIRTFLTGRVQCDGVTSVISGIPQLVDPTISVPLRPLLFVIFINDMPDLMIANYTEPSTKQVKTNYNST